jgi:hypothetical protein
MFIRTRSDRVIHIRHGRETACGKRLDQVPWTLLEKPQLGPEDWVCPTCREATTGKNRDR